MKPVLEIQNISKKFRISHQRQEYLSLREVIVSLFKSNRSKKEDFWALRDVSFNVMPGESLGIIGKNGAGKSTLLKVLSKITPPTAGRIISRGRIASLLEVGTGFHPELTGRENIFLNGSILGMKHKEIQNKFDEIVDFSGTEKFLDTPLKHYSSGMQLRLAFSVAAFLEPEILVIDEVLAVGDAEFQKKCIGKMESVSKSGRTILFVSHNMGIISALCKKAVLLNSGSIEMMDDIGKVIHTYLEKSIEVKNKDVTIEVNYSDKENLWTNGSNLILKIGWPEDKFKNGCICDIAFYTYDGVKIFSLQSNRVLQDNFNGKGKKKIVFEIENLGFAEKEMRIDIGLKSSAEGKYETLLENALSITPSGKNLFSYKANDTMVVPKANCYYED